MHMTHGRRGRCSTPIRRTPRLCASLLLALALFPSTARAQTPPDFPAPSDTLYEIRLGDGSLIVARVAELDQQRVTLITLGGGRLEIDRSQIQELRPARGRVVNDEFWSEDPGGTRLFFTATGRSLNRGESYVGTYVVVLPFASVGLTDRVTVGAGAPVLFGRFEPFYIAPKVQILRRPTVQAALGTLAFFSDSDVYGIAYGVGTFGDADNALSAGLGFFYSGEDVHNEPAAMLGGEFRMGRRIKLITENYLFPEALGVVVSGGIRVIGDRFSAEAGIAALHGEGTLDCCLPLINLSYAFGR